MNVDADAQAYIDAIAPANRPLFDRVAEFVAAADPDASVKRSYGIVAFVVGRQRLYVGAWKHGISLYGWRAGGDGGFAERHPQLLSGKGTIRLRPADVDALGDDLRALVVAALTA